MDQKFKPAHDLQGNLDVLRPTLLDSLDGNCHRAYGSIPNMTWIFTKTGIPVYKSDWTDAIGVEIAVKYFLGALTRGRSGDRLVPFHVERLDLRTRNIEAFYRALERNGPKAVREFRTVFP